MAIERVSDAFVLRRWWIRWQARHVWAAARRLAEPAVSRRTVAMTHRSEIHAIYEDVSVVVALDGGRDCALSVCLRFPSVPSLAGLPWQVEPLSLTIDQGPEVEGIAWVAGPLHAMAMARDRCIVESSGLIFETARLRRDRRWLPKLLARMRMVVSNLLSQPPVMTALEQSAKAPHTSLRGRSLRLMLAVAADPPARRKVSIRALFDRDPSIRLMGAMEAGALGHPSLTTLMLDEALSVADRERAVIFLVSEVHPEALGALLQMCVQGDPSLFSSALFEAIAARVRALGSSEALMKLLGSDGITDKVAEDTVRVLWSLRSELFVPEPPALLRHVPASALAGVIDGLAECAGTEAIEPLKELSGDPRALGMRARWALGRILTRTRGGRGALAITGVDARGGLSAPGHRPDTPANEMLSSDLSDPSAPSARSLHDDDRSE
ncbi:MAG: hypothetical protein AAFN74_14670 [Myxococcota bacterium]